MVVPRTILITGSSSEIGLMAAKMLFRNQEANHTLLLVARTPEKAYAIKQEVAESFTEGDSSRIVPLNEAKDGIDVACLNPGICTARKSDPVFTEDDLELTIATNHFGGNFLLMHGIVNLMKPGGRVVVTASEVQNMKQNDKTLPSFNDFVGMKDENGKAKKHFPMIDGSDFHYFRAYQSSKLCNVAFSAETGFFRYQNRFLLPIFQFFANHVMRVGETTEWGAKCLVLMATDESTGKTGGQYWNAPRGTSRKGGTHEEDLKPRNVNPEAVDEDNQKQLWRLSAEIVGADENDI